MVKKSFAASKNLQNLLAMDGPSRYRFALAHIQKSEVLWIVESKNFTLTWQSEDGTELLPIWPMEIQADRALNVDERSQGFTPVKRHLDDWLSRSTPALIAENFLVGIFPNERRMCPLVAPDQFAAHLSDTQQQFLQARDLSALSRSVRKKV